MSQTLSSHLRAQLTQNQKSRNSNRTRCSNRFTLRSVLVIILIVLISSSFFFDIELQMYWSSQPDLSFQTLQHRLDLSLSTSSINWNVQNIKAQHNLLTNQSEFDELLSYYTQISDSNYPDSWIHLNEQLFCPIRHSTSLGPINAMSNAAERLLKFIYNKQFVTDCDDPTHKYVIFDIGQTEGTGIGATFNGGILKYFVRAMMSDRILLINGEFEWAKDALHCQEYIGMECYFLPPSNCNPIDIISKTDPDDIWMGSIPTHCTLGDTNNMHLKWCDERIIYSNVKSSGWYPRNEDINKWIHSHLTHNISIFSNFVEFKAVLQSFVFRLQPPVRCIVMQKVRNALVKSLSNHKFDPFKSISFPIRASDKCYDNKLSLHGEMECWTKEELFLILQSVHTLNKDIDTVIFTSEDADFVDELIECITLKTHCDNTTEMNIFDNYLDFKWNIIKNDEDTRPSIGNAKYRVYHERKKYKFRFVKDINIDLEHDVVVGALSSMMLQMNSKYVVHTKSSSWLDNIWNIASALFCESILWSQELKLNGFNTKSNDKEIQKEFDRLNIEYERPYFLPQFNDKYELLDRYCFELKQYGTLNKKTKWKHVLYPVDIWDSFHALNLTPKLFYSLFGIQIYENGWNNYCQRYTKLPFDPDVDFGV